MKRTIVVLGRKPEASNAMHPQWAFDWEENGAEWYEARVDGGALAVLRCWNPPGGDPGSRVIFALGPGQWTMASVDDEVIGRAHAG